MTDKAACTVLSFDAWIEESSCCFPS